MPFSDRAFRALAREEPAVVTALLEIVAPGLLPAGSGVLPEHVADPHLDPPPTLDADWVARVGEDEVLHVECQGYRDADFAERLTRYHLSLQLRYPDRRVRSVALWVIRPPPSQRLRELSWWDVRFDVTSLVLPDLPAEPLLAGRGTACFAPGADAGALSDEALCDATVRALQDGGASERQRLVAVVLAATRGRYGAMVEAMRRAQMEPVIIEDLVRFGEDRGIEKGIEKGIEEGVERGRRELAGTLLDILRTRGMEPSRDERARIEAEASLEQLGRWCRRAALKVSLAEIFGPDSP